MPSISSSVNDPNKSLDISAQEPVQNNRESDSSDDDDDNDDENSTSVVNRSTTTTTATPTKAKATGAGNKSAAQTPKRAAGKRNPANVSKDSPDENENCRVSMTPR